MERIAIVYVYHQHRVVVVILSTLRVEVGQFSHTVFSIVHVQEYFFLISYKTTIYLQGTTNYYGYYYTSFTVVIASTELIVSKACLPFIVTVGRNPDSSVIPHLVGINQNNGHGPVCRKEQRRRGKSDKKIIQLERNKAKKERLT